MKLNNAYPRTPDGFRNMIESTLAQLPQCEVRRVPHTRALLAAALIALMCGGAALAAAQLGLLDMVFGDRTPSEAAKQTIVLLDKSQTREGYSLAACQYLIDGNKIHISCELGVEAPDGALALVRTQSGASGYVSTGELDDDMLQMLGGDFEQSTQLYECLVYDELPDKPFDVTVDAWLLQPMLPVKPYTPTDAEMLGMDKAGALPSLDSDAILADAESGIVQLSRRTDYAALSADIDMHSADNMLELMTKLGIARNPVRLSVTFTVDPGRSAGALRTLEQPVAFDFEEYSLIVRRADFNSASALILFEVHPRRTIAKMTMYNDDPLYRNYEVRLPDGTPIDAVNGGGFSTERDARGNVYLDYELRLSGLSQLPDAITLTPYRTGADGTNTYAETETVSVQLAKGGTK